MLQFLKINILHPLKELIHDSKAIGITLLCCTFISLFIANYTPFSNSFIHFFEFHFDASSQHHTTIGFLHLPNSPLIIINDFLMAFFFLLAGMEIKREFLNGELSSFKNAVLPIVSAIGGMLMPTILFYIFNKNTNYLNGWAIPTATDIAFTLGIASLLGNKVPFALKIFITALAIIDDLGAIVVIALFYGSSIKVLYLLGCAAFAIIILATQKLQKKFNFLQILLCIALWYCMFNSGIHATVSGVVIAFLIPIHQLKKLELKLHTPVYFIIMPLFALANTAIVLPHNLTASINNTLSWGIILGLVVGKPLGIFSASFVLIKLQIAQLPAATNWYQLLGVSILAGIGFTMSIFIAILAFKTNEAVNISKISVLIASLLAMIIGYIWLQLGGNKKVQV